MLWGSPLQAQVQGQDLGKCSWKWHFKPRTRQDLNVMEMLSNIVGGLNIIVGGLNMAHNEILQEHIILKDLSTSMLVNRSIL